MKPSILKALILGALVGTLAAVLSSLPFGVDGGRMFHFALAFSVPPGLLAGLALGVLARQFQFGPWIRRLVLLGAGPIAVFLAAMFCLAAAGLVGFATAPAPLNEVVEFAAVGTAVAMIIALCATPGLIPSALLLEFLLRERSRARVFPLPRNRRAAALL